MVFKERSNYRPDGRDSKTGTINQMIDRTNKVMSKYTRKERDKISLHPREDERYDTLIDLNNRLLKERKVSPKKSTSTLLELEKELKGYENKPVNRYGVKTQRVKSVKSKPSTSEEPITTKESNRKYGVKTQRVKSVKSKPSTSEELQSTERSTTSKKRIAVGAGLGALGGAALGATGQRVIFNKRYKELQELNRVTRRTPTQEARKKQLERLTKKSAVLGTALGALSGGVGGGLLGNRHAKKNW